MKAIRIPHEQALPEVIPVPGGCPESLLTIGQILAWADAHHAATGTWPSSDAGPIGQSSSSLRWGQIDHALKNRLHGLPAGHSLQTLLHEHRRVEPKVTVETVRVYLDTMRREKAARRVRRPTLRLDQILAWADAHHAATGKWPCNRSGAVRDCARGALGVA